MVDEKNASVGLSVVALVEKKVWVPQEQCASPLEVAASSLNDHHYFRHDHSGHGKSWEKQTSQNYESRILVNHGQELDGGCLLCGRWMGGLRQYLKW